MERTDGSHASQWREFDYRLVITLVLLLPQETCQVCGSVVSTSVGVAFDVRFQTQKAYSFLNDSCNSVFSALMLLVGRQEGHPACKN